MSYYDVKLLVAEPGGNIYPASIHDPEDPALTLTDARVNIVFAEAGSFDFTIGPNNPFYDSIVPFGSTIRVLEDGEEIFYGRPLYPQTDIFGRKTYHCEGALAFLNDYVIPPGRISTHGTDEDIESWIIDGLFNNAMSPYRRLNIQGVQHAPADEEWLIEAEFATAKEALGKILEHCGGYFYTVPYTSPTVHQSLVWAEEPPAVGLAPIEVGLNMQDMTTEGMEYFTAAIAKGADADPGATVLSPTQMYEPVTVPEDVEKYGFICKYLEFPEEKTVEGLKTKCAAWLASQNINEQHIDVTALDLHAINGGYESFMIGRGAHIVNSAIGLDVVLPITSVTIEINTGQKSIGVGGALNNSLTRPKRQAVPKQNQLYLTDQNGNKYVPYVDSNGDVKTKDVIVAFWFSEEYTGPYYVGDVFDPWRSYVIMGQFGDGTIRKMSPVQNWPMWPDVTPYYEFQESGNPETATFVSRLVPSIPIGVTTRLNFAGHHPGPDLNTIYTPIPNSCSQKDGTANWSVDYYSSGVRYLEEITYVLGTGATCTKFSRTASGKTYVYPLFASAQSGRSITQHHVKTNISTQEIIIDTTEEYSLASQYTYDSKTVYYRFAYGSSPIVTIDENGIWEGMGDARIKNGYGVSDVSAEAGKIAWTLIYGGQNENDSYQMF